MQSHFKNILAFQDGYSDSVEALELGSRLAAKDVKISVIDVQPPLSEFWHDFFDEEFEESPSYHRHNSLRELVKGVDFGASTFTTRVLTGRPVVEIIQNALSGDHDLLIKEANSKTTDFLFGSLDMRLIRCCPIPVWTINALSNPEIQHVLVAINSEAQGNEQKLNSKLIQHASAIANVFNCKLHVVAAYQVPVRLYGHSVQADLVERYERQEKQYRRTCREALSACLAESNRPINPENVSLECGSPDEVILSAVQSKRPDLLVLGSVARQGLSGLLIGNTAERVLRKVECSVLTLKPEGFVSPITNES